MSKSCTRSGFTLIELMAVIVIIGILAGLVLGLSRFATQRAAESRTRAELQLIRNALEEYRLHFGRYPAVYYGEPNQATGTSGDWDDFMMAISDAELTRAIQDLEELRPRSAPFTDPWGIEYVYMPEGRFSYDLFSHGPSGPNANGEDRTYDQIR